MSRWKKKGDSPRTVSGFGGAEYGRSGAGCQRGDTPSNVLVTDVGQNQMMAARYFKYTQERSIVTSGGLGTMGFSLPATTSGQPSDVDPDSVRVYGRRRTSDEYSELGTIMEQQAPVKIICMNNNFLGNVRQWQAMFFNGRYSFTPMQNPDYEDSESLRHSFQKSVCT